MTAFTNALNKYQTALEHARTATRMAQEALSVEQAAHTARDLAYLELVALHKEQDHE